MLTFMRKHAGKILIGTFIFFILSIEIPFVMGKNSNKRDTGRMLKRELRTQDIAFVDGQAVNERKFVQIVNQQLNMLVPPQQKSQLDPRLRAQVMYSALQQTIDYSLMLRETKRERIHISWGEINREVEGVRNAYKVKSTREFKKLLKQNGFTLSQFKQMVRDELAVQKLMRKVQGDLTITDADIKNKFKKVKASHILIKTEYGNAGDKATSIKKSDEAALAQAEDLYKRLLKGEDFSKLAREFSADERSAEKGGDLGWFGQGQMVPEFETVAFAMEKGQLSKPVKTVFGYHIIKLTDVKQGVVPIDVDEEETKKQLTEERKRQRIDNWYRHLLKKADIEVVARSLLAYKYKMDGDLEKALREYRLLAAENPQDPTGHMFIAEIYEMMGNLAEASAEYQRAMLKIKVAPGVDNPFVHMGYGTLLMRRGERSTAKQEFLKAEKLLGDNITGYETLRRDYERFGYTADAKRMASKVAQLKVQFSTNLEQDLERELEKRATAPAPENKEQKGTSTSDALNEIL